MILPPWLVTRRSLVYKVTVTVKMVKHTCYLFLDQACVQDSARSDHPMDVPFDRVAFSPLATSLSIYSTPARLLCETASRKNSAP